MYNHLEKSDFNDVGKFHARFDLPNVTYGGVGPQEIDPELLRFRLNFLLEELQELMDATNMTWSRDPGELSIVHCDPGEEAEVDHAQAFDALLDLVYVAHGTAHLLGYPWREGWDLVQRANMSKVRAQKDGSDSKRGSSFDVVKPEGWTPPDIEGLLRDYGWSINNKENDQ